MYIKVEDPEAHKYDVIDLNTGHKIPCVQEANDETGEFTVLLRDEDGGLLYDTKIEDYILFKFKGNIKLVKKEENNGKKE
jgi:hypothetical protein